MEILESIFLNVWNLPYVRYLAVHILVNFVVGVAAAIHVGVFDWAKVGDFFYRKLLPYLMVFSVTEAFGEAAGLDWLSLAAFGLIQLNLLNDLAGSLSALGIPIPEFALNRRDREPASVLDCGDC
jgi:hypothetical protein